MDVLTTLWNGYVYIYLVTVVTFVVIRFSLYVSRFLIGTGFRNGR